MKCVICNSPDIELMEIKEEFKIGNNIIYILIRTPVCKNCGERYYDRRTMKFLEETEQKLRREQLKLEEVGKILIAKSYHFPQLEQDAVLD